MCTASPLESNILEWHYVIEGIAGSPYEKGWYHGTVIFPPEYPYKPPAIRMVTTPDWLAVFIAVSLAAYFLLLLLI